MGKWVYPVISFFATLNVTTWIVVYFFFLFHLTSFFCTDEDLLEYFWSIRILNAFNVVSDFLFLATIRFDILKVNQKIEILWLPVFYEST